MTAPRLSRGSRGRFFLYVACLLGFFGLVAIYHNALTQLDAAKKSNEICSQQQESSAAQLQVIFEYKTRLEKSLQGEKAEHKQTRTELQKRVENEKKNCDKNTMEANQRFASLQQQFNILESNNKDLQQDFAKVQKEKSISDKKVTEVEDELKEKEKTFQSLKSEYLTIQNEKSGLEKQLEKIGGSQLQNESEMDRLLKENNQLKQEIEYLKDSCNKNRQPETENRDIVQSEHVGDQPSAADNPENKHPPNPIDESLNVLPEPNIENQNKKSSTTTTTTPKTNNMAMQPIASATPSVKKPTKETLQVMNNNQDNVLVAPNTVDEQKKIKKEIPPGVVPVPEDKLDKLDIEPPNRYRNSILAAEEPQKPLRKPNVDENQENGAMEVIDPPNRNEYPFNVLGNQNDVDVAAEAPEQPLVEAKKHIDSLGKNQIPRQGLRLGPMHYDAADGGEYDKQDEKGGDLQLDEAEGEGEDDADDEYNDARHKDPAVRN